jgi:hypothetical protein
MIDTQAVKQIDILGGGTDHVCPTPFCQLNCNVSYSSRCAMDEHRLPGLEMALIEEACPGYYGNVWKCGGVVMVQGGRLCHYIRSGYDHIFRIRSIPKDASFGKYSIAG